VVLSSVSRVLVTGANGFVGRAVCAALPEAGFEVRAAVRSPKRLPEGLDGGEVVSVGEICARTDWRSALEGVDTVVHLAGRVHVLKERLKDAQPEFRRVNVLGSEKLARAAAEAGVRRLVHVSSIGVNGISTPSRPFTEADEPHPHNHYSISKWEGEKAMRRVAGETGLELVVLRPPLVYGPGVKANFLRLMHLVDRRLPLPLASVNNRRSLIYVGNLADAVVTCVTRPEAAGELFLVSDGEDVSTPGLLRSIAAALRKPALLAPFPPTLLRAGGRVARRPSMVEPLLDSLMVDATRIHRTLGWRPAYTMAQGLKETARWYERAGNGYAP
jgi:nucleoside-diphosphate-sugar epimerase